MKRTFDWIKNLHTKKPHIEVITAILTVPVLITVIALNLNNLNKDKKTEPKTQEKVVVQTVSPTNPDQKATPEVCKKSVGPISIETPKEDETVTTNPVFVNIKYSDSDYCSVVWSYRINSGTWSEFSSNDVSLFNPPNGNIKFELRVQSTVSQDKKNLERNFTYKGSGTVSTPEATSSAH